jgi:hypothetical protein
MRFSGLDLHGRVTGARRIWPFREIATNSQVIGALKPGG